MAAMEMLCLAMLSMTQSIFSCSPQMLICRMVNGSAGGVDMGVLGEGALGLLVQQGPVKVEDNWADVDSPEHERWTHLVHLLHCTEHLVMVCSGSTLNRSR